MKSIVALFCCASLLAGQTTVPEQQRLRQKAVSIPIGSIVEANLANKKEKVKGQLVSVADTGLTIRTADGGTVGERTVPFAEIKGLKEKKGSDTALKIFAGVGIALTALFLIGIGIAWGS